MIEQLMCLGFFNYIKESGHNKMATNKIDSYYTSKL